MATPGWPPTGRGTCGRIRISPRRCSRPDGYAVIAADFDGNIIAYNEGARQIYGYDPAEVFGRHNIETFFPADFIEAGYFQQAIDVLLATGRFVYEGEKVRKRGERFPAQILFTLTKDRTGKVVGFVEIVEDPHRAQAGRGEIAAGDCRAQARRGGGGGGQPGQERVPGQHEP